jgi:hypothetical protein
MPETPRCVERCVTISVSNPEDFHYKSPFLNPIVSQKLQTLSGVRQNLRSEMCISTPLVSPLGTPKDFFTLHNNRLDRMVICRRVNRATPATPCRRTHYAIPLFIKCPRSSHHLERYRNLSPGHPSAIAAVCGARFYGTISKFLLDKKHQNKYH